MAKGRKTGGRDVQPGQRLNPHGRPPLPPELKEMQRLSKGELELLITTLLRAPPEALTTFRSSSLERTVAASLIHGINTGSLHTLMSLLDRVLGKVSDKVEVSSEREVWSLEEKKKVLIQAREEIERLEEEVKTEENA